MKTVLHYRTGGFTLIELVVVIALLGILAAFAVPRFASLEREARIATTQGLSGSVRGAAAMAHSLYLATNSANPVTMEGIAVNLTNGYPDATDIHLALADTAGFNRSVNGGGSQATFARLGAPDPATCAVVYEDAAAGFAPDIAINLSGC